MAVVDRNRRLEKETMVMFADAEKCFDKLWLKDCMVDMVKRGTRESEAAMIYKMNEKAKIKIITPFGMTEEIVAERVKGNNIWTSSMLWKHGRSE